MQEIGETRQAMRDDLLTNKLHKIIKDAHKDKKLNEFWILISHKPDQILAGVIREGVVVTNKRPPKMLSTMCFHVIYNKGFIEPEWILPTDFGIELNPSGSPSELVLNSAASIGSVLR